MGLKLYQMLKMHVVANFGFLRIRIEKNRTSDSILEVKFKNTKVLLGIAINVVTKVLTQQRTQFVAVLILSTIETS